MAEANQRVIITSELCSILSPICCEIIPEQSFKEAQRSNDQATILLYGKSGDGKSTTLNYLFGSDIILTSEESSKTRKVTEYGCSIKSSSGSRTKKIGFIDTPGLFDTDGIEKDSENMANISHFIETHPKLHKDGKRNYPNIVLVVISATNRGLFGISSTFSRMLHVLTNLNVVDIFHPNVVVVVTNAMHFTKEKYIQKSSDVKINCQVLTRAHLSFEVPVVFIENLDERNEMELEGDWRILPDGTRQPLNLFDAMINVMKQSGDRIGVEAVRLSFCNSKNLNFKEIKSNPIDHEFYIFPKSRWRRFIDRNFFDQTQNQIFLFLSNHIGSDDIRIFPFAYHLEKINIVKPTDLRERNFISIKQSLQPYQLSQEETGWLLDLFEVTRMKVELDFKLLGLGYSRQFKDIRKRILEIKNLKDVSSPKYYFKIPTQCTAKELKRVTIDIVYDETAQWFVMKYLKLSFRICYLLFQVDVDEVGDFNLDVKFIEKLKRALPEGVAPDNIEYKFENPDFTEFIKDYALHCTTGVYFGGYFEGVLCFKPQKDEATSRRFLVEKTDILSEQLNTYFGHIQNGVNPLKTHFEHDEEIYHKLQDCTLTWGGGNKLYHSGKFFDINVNTWNKWVYSIEENVVCLDWMMNSMSIFDILQKAPNENINIYAEQFSCITNMKQVSLAELKFMDVINLAEKQENNVLTRVEASKRAQHCIFL